MNNVLRVLHVYCGPFPTPQGTQTLIKQTCLLSAEHNIDTHLICYHHGHDSTKAPPCFTIHRIADFPRFTSERSGPAVSKIPLDLNFAYSLKKKIAKLQPDILHAHHYEALLVCKLANPFGKIPVVFHQHAAFEPELPTYAHDIFSKPLQKLGHYIDTTLPFLAHYTIAVCQTNFEKLRQILPPHQTTLLIPPAMDYPKLCRPIQNKKVTAVYVGNLDRYQNIETLISAISRLDKTTEDNFTLRIITNSLIPAVLSRRAKCLRTIEFHPHDSFQSVWRMICQADFVIIPRKLPGGIPIKMITALAAGTPVVVNPIVVPELSKNEACFADTSKAEEIAEAIVTLVHNAPLRKKLAQTSPSTLKRLFRPDKYVEHLKSIYYQVML